MAWGGRHPSIAQANGRELRSRIIAKVGHATPPLPFAYMQHHATQGQRVGLREISWVKEVSSGPRKVR